MHIDRVLAFDHSVLLLDRRAQGAHGNNDMLVVTLPTPTPAFMSSDRVASLHVHDS